MTEFDNIASVESIKLLLYITTSVLVVSVGIIGYFMSRRDHSITTATDNLTSAVQQLKTIVNSLQLQHQIKQPLVDAAIELHRQALETNSVIIKDMDARLIKIETEHKMFHCSFPVSKRKTKKDENTD
jgi:hypothetical protein